MKASWWPGRGKENVASCIIENNFNQKGLEKESPGLFLFQSEIPGKNIPDENN